METSRQLTLADLSRWISSVEDSPARTYPWLDAARAWLEAGAPCSGSSPESQRLFALAGYLSKTSQDFSALNLAETFSRSSVRWMNGGTAWGGGCLTLRTSESPSDVAACSLSDILEPHAHPRFYLSPRACQGILRRAEKRGRALPLDLHEALATTAGLAQGETDQTTSSPTVSGGIKAYLSTLGIPNTPSPSGQQTEPTGETGTLSDGPGHSMPAAVPVRRLPLSVRRLTPTECSRLQGFPDDWACLED